MHCVLPMAAGFRLPASWPPLTLETSVAGTGRRDRARRASSTSPARRCSSRSSRRRGAERPSSSICAASPSWTPAGCARSPWPPQRAQERGRPVRAGARRGGGDARVRHHADARAAGLRRRSRGGRRRDHEVRGRARRAIPTPPPRRGARSARSPTTSRRAGSRTRGCSSPSSSRTRSATPELERRRRDPARRRHRRAGAADRGLRPGPRLRGGRAAARPDAAVRLGALPRARAVGPLGRGAQRRRRASGSSSTATRPSARTSRPPSCPDDLPDGCFFSRLAVAVALDRREARLERGHEVGHLLGLRRLGLHGDLLAGGLALDQLEHLLAVLVLVLLGLEVRRERVDQLLGHLQLAVGDLEVLGLGQVVDLARARRPRRRRPSSPSSARGRTPGGSPRAAPWSGSRRARSRPCPASSIACSSSP